MDERRLPKEIEDAMTAFGRASDLFGYMEDQGTDYEAAEAERVRDERRASLVSAILRYAQEERSRGIEEAAKHVGSAWHLADIKARCALVEEIRSLAAPARSEGAGDAARLREALNRWGLVRWQDDDEGRDPNGPHLTRCRECGRIAKDPAPVQHKKRCSVGALLAAPARSEAAPAPAFVYMGQKGNEYAPAAPQTTPADDGTTARCATCEGRGIVSPYGTPTTQDRYSIKCAKCGGSCAARPEGESRGE